MVFKMWIEYKDKKPKINQDVYYFFSFLGVNKGIYGGNHIFYGKKGFLQGDVTHWMPVEFSDDIPTPPFYEMYIISIDKKDIIICSSDKYFDFFKDHDYKRTNISPEKYSEYLEKREKINDIIIDNKRLTCY